MPSQVHAGARDDVITGAGVVPVFQPIVDLTTGSVVAYEALARWPGRPDVDPGRVFALAVEHGTLVELDRSCRRAAVDGAVAGGLPPGATLFVNAEPAGLTADTAGPLADLDARGLSLVIELTERALLRAPGDLLRVVAGARAAGLRIALDDVGACPDSLALLDLVMPDVIKLDLALVQESPSSDQARTLAAVMAHRERTGTTVLAEGIESATHRERALACGATLGQGWLLGRPAPLDATAAGLERLPLPLDAGRPTPATPADLLAEFGTTQVASKRWLVALTRHLETQADNPADPPVVLSTLQTVARFTPTTRDRYRHLAGRSPLVAVFATDMAREPEAGVRGVAIADDDPLLGEWTIVALGAQTAAALIARDLGDTGPDAERRFEFVITYDRAVVTRAARSLVSRLVR